MPMIPLGYTREELIGQPVLIVYPPERREEAAQITRDMLEGKVEFCPVPLQTRDGVQILVETRVKMGEWDGHPVLFGVSKDISRLMLSEEKFSKAFHASATMMALSNAQSGLYIDVNESRFLFGSAARAPDRLCRPRSDRRGKRPLICPG